MTDYVTNESWVRTVGRPDTIDEIADQFERPGAADFWAQEGGQAVPWPSRSRGWRTEAGLKRSA